jgi:hypothetical protein
MVRETVEHEDASHILSVVAQMISDGRAFPGENGVRIPVTLLVQRAREGAFPGITSQRMHEELKAAGFKKKQIWARENERPEAGRRYDGYEIDLRDDSPHRRAFKSHGIDLPPWGELQTERDAAGKRKELPGVP